MLQARKRTSMSVIEMGKRLGLGKTESYWLIKKNYFQTIMVGKRMRVMIASFEDWYANQCRYHKIDGTPPGAHIKEISMTADELGNLLGISEASAYELIAKGHFEKVDDLAKMRITKESFWKWYTAQTFYRTVEDQEEDKKLRQDAYTMPEIGKMLGLYRNISFQRVYSILCRLDGINVLQKTAFIVGMRASPTTKWWEKLIWKKGASNYGIYRKTKKEILCGLHIRR